MDQQELRDPLVLKALKDQLEGQVEVRDHKDHRDPLVERKV
jgi:hypothetical protein